MLAVLSEGQCLAGFLAVTGSGMAGLVATRGDGHQPPTAYVFREVAAAGCTTSWVSCIFNFTDVAKVRVQAGSADLHGSPYHGFRATLVRILHEEGLRAVLLPGIVASCLRDLSYSGLGMGLYPYMKQQLSRRSAAAGEDAGFARKFAAGAATGAIFSGLVSPTDFVKIAAQAEAGRVGATGLLETGRPAGWARSWPRELLARLRRDAQGSWTRRDVPGVQRHHGACGTWEGRAAGLLRSYEVAPEEACRYAGGSPNARDGLVPLRARLCHGIGPSRHREDAPHGRPRRPVPRLHGLLRRHLALVGRLRCSAAGRPPPHGWRPTSLQSAS